MLSSPVLPENVVLTCVAWECCPHLCCLRMLSSPALPENDVLTCVAWEWCPHLCCLTMVSSPVLSENDVLTWGAWEWCPQCVAQEGWPPCSAWERCPHLIAWEWCPHLCVHLLMGKHRIMSSPVLPSASGLSMGYSGMVSLNSSNMAAALSFPYWPKMCSGFWPLQQRNSKGELYHHLQSLAHFSASVLSGVAAKREREGKEGEKEWEEWVYKYTEFQETHLAFVASALMWLSVSKVFTVDRLPCWTHTCSAGNKTESRFFQTAKYIIMIFPHLCICAYTVFFLCVCVRVLCVHVCFVCMCACILCVCVCAHACVWCATSPSDLTSTL